MRACRRTAASAPMPKPTATLLDEVATPEPAGLALLTRAAERLRLSARGYHRVLAGRAHAGRSRRGSGRGAPPCRRSALISSGDQHCGTRRTLVAGNSDDRGRYWLAWIGAGALLLVIGLGWYLLPVRHLARSAARLRRRSRIARRRGVRRCLCLRGRPARAGVAADDRGRFRIRVLGSADRPVRGDGRRFPRFPCRSLFRPRQREAGDRERDATSPRSIGRFPPKGGRSCCCCD